MKTFLKTTELPTHGLHTLEGSWYTAPAVFEQEADRVFSRRWLCVGRAATLAVPGQYRLVTIGKESLILVRDRSGTLRAHFNVCRHRGSRLCEQPSGELSETIQCPYHAWTYSLDGRLVGVPDQRELEGFDKARYGLAQAHVAEWEGFVFINLADTPEPFAAWWAPMQERLARWNLGTLASGGRLAYDVRANWKLLFQNYSECYHCAPLHPTLVRLSPPTSGENDLVDGPFLGGFMTITRDGGSLTLSGGSCGLPVADLPGNEQQRVYYYSIFPNMLLSLHHDYVMVHTFQPLAPDRTLVACEFLFNPATLTDPACSPNDGIEFWDRVNREDWHICEQTQLGVSSRAYRPGPYSRRESLSAAFDRSYLEAMGVG